MKRTISTIMLIALVAIASAQEKQDSSTVKTPAIDQYNQWKAEYSELIKKDSFLVSIPIIAKEPAFTRVEIKKGEFKRHYIYSVIEVKHKWQYPEFDQAQFEEWLKNRGE